MSTTGPVIVGVDGSPSSFAAASYGAELAARRAASLHLVYGHSAPLLGYGGVILARPSPQAEEQARAEVERSLADAVEAVHKQHPELVDIQARQVPGHAAGVLIDLSRTAAVTVVGSRGTGGFAQLLLGSVAAQVAAHGHGAIVVVRPPVPDRQIPPGAERPPAHPLGPVVVGVDGSPPAIAAVDFAAFEAATRSVPLIAVHVYWPQTRVGLTPDKAEPDAERHAREAADRLLAEALAPTAAAHPQLQIDSRPACSPNVEQAMVDSSQDAALTVVGCRGRGGFAGLLLGSVSHALVANAHGPVAVVHPPEH